MTTKTALVLGAGGFIGGNLVKRLKREGFWVRGVDLKFPEFSETEADDFMIGDLRSADVCDRVVDRRFDEVYQLAADMGGAGYIFTGEHDADIMHNSATHQSQYADRAHKRNIKRGSSIPRPPACTRPTIRKIRTIRIAPNPRLIRLRPTANMAGRSCSRERLVPGL